MPSEWQEHFREWEFVPGDRLRKSGTDRLLLGTCIEGIRVEFDSPGFEGTPVLAIANVKGLNAPKTNVARSGIEATPERDAMLRKIYQMYVDHVGKEIIELYKNRSFSLTWATGEATYLLATLLTEGKSDSERVRPVNGGLLQETLENLSILLSKTLISVVQLPQRPFRKKGSSGQLSAVFFDQLSRLSGKPPARPHLHNSFEL